MDFLAMAKERMKAVEMGEDLLRRPVNAGFSGGEKKRAEIFQMTMLEPTLAILDETDSGLDIDALKAVSHGINLFRSPERALILGDALPAVAELRGAPTGSTSCTTDAW